MEVLRDALRITLFATMWAALMVLLRRVPGLRSGDGNAKLYGDRHKAAGIATSFVHSCAALVWGVVLQQRGELPPTRAWDAAMSEGEARCIAMLLGYLVVDLAMGWRGLSALHRVHHVCGLYAWGLPLLTRSPCAIVVVAYFVAEAPNPLMHARWLLRHVAIPGSGHLVLAVEAGFIAAWFLGRQVPELYLCWNHAWFELQLPLAWRLVVAAGNALTLVWSAQIAAMFVRRVRGMLRL